MRTTKAEREVVLAELQRLEALHGKVAPEVVVREARAKESPLHRYFDWNNKRAADKWRLEQARSLISSVKFDHRTERGIVRSVVFVRDPDLPSREQGYISLVTLRDDEERQRRLIIQECERAAGVLGRLREIKAVLGFKENLDAAIREIEVVRRSFERRVDEAHEISASATRRRRQRGGDSRRAA